MAVHRSPVEPNPALTERASAALDHVLTLSIPAVAAERHRRQVTADDAGGRAHHTYALARNC